MTTATSLKSTLSIQGLELNIHLGWPNEERVRKQIVLLDIEIKFSKPPAACQTDDLHNTICYATLIEYIHAQLAERKFHLLEHLAQEIYRLIQSQLSKTPANIFVRITKHPNIKGLTQGVCFGYGDV